MTQNNKHDVVVAIDTATDMLVCTVSWKDGTTGEREMLARDHMCRRHANEELVDTLDEALQTAGLGVDDIDRIVVGRGPGSFTGVHRNLDR